jgi:eukaryotic-like serine/threonine-protein kinase
VLEYLEGADLRSVLTTHGSLPVEEAVSLTLQACDALAEAHSRGMVHGDVRPEHLFLSRGPDGGALVKVLGLGIAKQDRVGSPLHRSPEQMGDPTAVDARTDVWSLGVVLYELFTGELPFEGESVSEVRANVKTAHPRSPRDLDPAISKGLAALVLRCLAKSPDARFPDAVVLGHALRAFGASTASIDAGRIEDILRHAGSVRPPAAAPSSSSPPASSSPQEAADEEIVRSSWLSDPPASPRSSPAPSSPDSVEEEIVRASWLMDPPEPSPMPTASQSVPAVPAAVLGSSSASMPAKPQPVPATPPPMPTSQSVPAGPTSRRAAPPPLPTSNAPRPSNSQRLLQVPTLRLPTILRLPKLPLPTTQRARVAVAGGLLGGLILALLWPNRPSPAAGPSVPAVSAAAPPASEARAFAPVRAASRPSALAPAGSVPLASASPSASPAPPSSQAPVLAPAPSSERPRAPSASRNPGVTTTTMTAPAKPPARPARSHSSSLFPVPKPVSW